MTYIVQPGTARACALSIAGERIAWVRIASTFRTRFIGLLDRKQLDVREGLLFDPGGSIHTLWMRFAIDIVFLDARGEVLRIASRVKPWRWVRAPQDTRFVLELSAGAAQAFALATGVRLQWGGSDETIPTQARC